MDHAVDLELVSTDALEQELQRRSEDCVIVRSKTVCLDDEYSLSMCVAEAGVQLSTAQLTRKLGVVRAAELALEHMVLTNITGGV